MNFKPNDFIDNILLFVVSLLFVLSAVLVVVVFGVGGFIIKSLFR